MKKKRKVTSLGYGAAPRRDGTAWELYWKDNAGKWRCHRIPPKENVTTRKQAMSYGARVIDDLRAGRLGCSATVPAKEEAAGPTFADLEDKWIRLLKELVTPARAMNEDDDSTEVTTSEGIKPSTARAHEINVATILDMIGNVRVVDFDVPRARQWVRDLCKRPLTPKKKDVEPDPEKTLAPFSVRNIFFSLKRLFDDAIAEGWVTGLVVNPLASDKVIKALPKAITRAGNEVIFIPKADVEKLLACPKVDDYWRTIYFVAVLAGLRADEIAALRFDDLVFEDEVPHLNVDKTVDRHEGDVIVTDPKSAHGKRKVPMHPLLRDVLTIWKERGWVVRLGKKPASTDPVFPDLEGRFRTLNDGALRLRNHLERAGCTTTQNGANLTLHAARRSFGTFLLEAGVEERIRTRLMGQSSPGVNARYAATELPILRDAIVRLDLKLEVKAANDAAEVDSASDLPAPRGTTRGEKGSKASRTAENRWRRGSDSNRRVTVLQVILMTCEAMQDDAIGDDKDEVVVEQAHVPHAPADACDRLLGGRSRRSSPRAAGSDRAAGSLPS